MYILKRLHYVSFTLSLSVMYACFSKYLIPYANKRVHICFNNITFEHALCSTLGKLHSGSYQTNATYSSHTWETKLNEMSKTEHCTKFRTWHINITEMYNFRFKYFSVFRVTDEIQIKFVLFLCPPDTRCINSLSTVKYMDMSQ